MPVLVVNSSARLDVAAGSTLLVINGRRMAPHPLSGTDQGVPSLSPNASDKVQGPDIGGTDNKDLINTKATSRRGDYVDLGFGQADGPTVLAIRGTWATEA